MLPLVAAVFTASLLGSLHCAGMCGPFVAFAVGSTESRGRITRQLAYHGGRLTTYVILGLAAGAAGALLDLSAALAGLQPVAMAVAGGLMVAFGLAAIAQHYGWRLLSWHPPGSIAWLLRTAHRTASHWPPLTRSLVIGMSSTLLPCGWLYAFAITAAGTGHPLKGAIVMAVFWLGTVPVLAALGVGIQTILGPIGRRLPTLTALALVVVGCMTLSGRFALSPQALAATVTADAAEQTAPSANELPACCRERLEKVQP